MSPALVTFVFFPPLVLSLFTLVERRPERSGNSRGRHRVVLLHANRNRSVPLLQEACLPGASSSRLSKVGEKPSVIAASGPFLMFEQAAVKSLFGQRVRKSLAASGLGVAGQATRLLSVRAKMNGPSTGCHNWP